MDGTKLLYDRSMVEDRLNRIIYGKATIERTGRDFLSLPDRPGQETDSTRMLQFYSIEFYSNRILKA